MPAWYTNNTPTNDAQVAAHFSSRRPILGLCLKRYSFTPDGRAIRLSTQVDIPVEIAVPHFIQDENVDEHSGLNSNFKLSLQAVVCHRGDSVDSGHYISLVRGTDAPGSSDALGPYTDTTKQWLRFDDLAQTRISVIDIETALKEETPYLLFYQIVPIEGDPGNIATGDESLSTVNERNASLSEVSDVSAVTDSQSLSGRPSFDINIRDESRGRSPTEIRRASVTPFQEPPRESTDGGTTRASLTVPNNSGPAGTQGPQSVSRSQSKASEGRGIGRTLSKLKRKSREVLPLPADNSSPADTQVKELPERTIQAPAPQTAHPSTSPGVVHTGPKPTTLQVQHQYQQPKTHKREKSRGRKSKNKPRGEKPDRECIVM